MSRYLADRISRSPRIVVHLSTEVRAVVGDRRMESVIVEHQSLANASSSIRSMESITISDTSDPLSTA
jgi:hypothetical protein